MQKTFQALQKELVDSKKREQYLKKRTSTLREELTKTRQHMRGLIVQYERVVRDWRNTALDYQGHLYKLSFVSLFNKIKEKLRG